MYQKALQDFYNKYVRLREYNNVVEAARCAMAIIIRKYSGTSVYDIVSLPGNQISSSFSITGFIFFILWISAYFYCTFITYYYDQTILRMLYSTKLKRYGDDFERFTSLIYVLFIIVLIPFRVSGNRVFLQKIVDIDLVIQKSGDIMDYHKIARIAITVALVQCLVYFIRIICIWFTLTSSIVMPFEKMFQVIYSDALALVSTSLYCYFVSILRDRFKWINRTLCEIKLQKSWEYKVFVRGKVPAKKMVKVMELQDRHICEKIKTCARVYSMLFDICENMNRLFGLVLLLTLLQYFNYLILYLFYFMEATASGLFHDMKRYCDFFVYTFWEIVIAVGIIFLIVGFSESTLVQAKKTSSLTHDIINADLSPVINQEAMYLSVLLLHETPAFTVCGLFDLTYVFIQQGARSVATYLIILLQFVTENNHSI